VSRRKRSRAGTAVLPEAARRTARVSRSLRVAGELRQELAAALRALEDPRLGGVGITRVELSDDLQFARVYVRIAYGEDLPESRARTMHALSVACGRLRRRLGATLELRRTPRLRFLYDEGPDAAQRVEALLDQIRQEEG